MELPRVAIPSGLYSQIERQTQAARHLDTTGILHLKQFALGMIDESGLS